jgi:hypothetical protein
MADNNSSPLEEALAGADLTSSGVTDAPQETGGFGGDWTSERLKNPLWVLQVLATPNPALGAPESRKTLQAFEGFGGMEAYPHAKIAKSFHSQWEDVKKENLAKDIEGSVKPPQPKSGISFEKEAEAIYSEMGVSNDEELRDMRGLRAMTKSPTPQSAISFENEADAIYKEMGVNGPDDLAEYQAKGPLLEPELYKMPPIPKPGGGGEASGRGSAASQVGLGAMAAIAGFEIGSMPFKSEGPGSVAEWMPGRSISKSDNGAAGMQAILSAIQRVSNLRSRV